MRVLLPLVAGLLLVLAGGPTHAHTGSYDLKYVDGSNLLLLTFNTHQPVSGLEIEHNIRLYDLVGAPIVYEEVHVEVHARADTQELALPGTSVITEETLPMLPTNESKLSYTYPMAGSYTVTAEFFADGRPISKGSFAVDVGAGGGSAGFGPWALGVAFLTGVAVTLPFLRRRGKASGLGPEPTTPESDSSVGAAPSALSTTG